MRFLILFLLWFSFCHVGVSQKSNAYLLSHPDSSVPDSLLAIFHPDSLFPANPLLQLNNQFTGTFISSDGLVVTTKKMLQEFNKDSGGDTETTIRGAYARRQLFVKEVTEQVLEGVKANFSSEKKSMYAQRNIRRLINQEKKQQEGLQIEIKAIHQGRHYLLYAWETFADIRLVSVEEEKGLAKLRIYQNDQPFRPEHFLTWSETAESNTSWAALYGYPKESFLYTLPMQKKAFFNQLLPLQIQSRNTMLEAWEENRSDQKGLERQLERLQLEKVGWEELAYQDLILYIQARVELAHNEVLGQLEATHPYRETLELQQQQLADWVKKLKAAILSQEILQKNLQLFNLFRQLEFLERPAVNTPVQQQKEAKIYLDNFYRSFDRELEMALFEKAMELYFTQLPPAFQSYKVGQKYAESTKDFQEMSRIAFASSLFFKPELVQAKLDQGIDAFVEMLKRDYLYEVWKEIKQSEKTLNRKQLPEIESQMADFQRYYYDALSQQKQLLPEANGSLRFSMGQLEEGRLEGNHHALEGMEGAPLVDSAGKIVGIFTSSEQALLDLSSWIYEGDLVKWKYKK